MHVQLNRIGSNPAEADRCLDAMEQSTGLRGEVNTEGRWYDIDGSLDDGANLIVANLPTGWQDHLSFEV